MVSGPVTVGNRTVRTSVTENLLPSTIVSYRLWSASSLLQKPLNAGSS